VSAVEICQVRPEEAEQRLDRWFKRRYPALTHGALEKLLRTGQVRVDGKRAKANTRLLAGQSIRVPPQVPGLAPASQGEPDRPQPVDLRQAEELQGRVLYRDDWLIALDKPSGLAVQGGSGQHRHLDAMLGALSFGAEERPRLVHRLDKDTAGVLVLARSLAAARRLSAAFKEDRARKTYWALVAGVPAQPRGRIAVPLGKLGGPKGEKMVADAPDSKPAETRYAVVASAGCKAAWLALRPLTGRTHQLRAHCAVLGHPILGDGKYGGKAAFPAAAGLPQRLMLLAREIALPHPDDGTTFRVRAPMPPHMTAAFEALGFDPDSEAAESARAWLESH
jgi:23S rRNA pseudouridine955/2504/2580 synthase